jgi:hypothetical protein
METETLGRKKIEENVTKEGLKMSFTMYVGEL